MNRSNDRHSLPRYLAGRNGASYLVRGYTTRAGRILSLIYDISLEFRSILFIPKVIYTTVDFLLPGARSRSLV